MGETHICEYCSKEFSTLGNLKSHIKMSHLKIKDHICNECEEAFCQKRSLELHKMKLHGGQKADLCFLCGTSCYTGTALSHHMARVHNLNTNCETCKKKYRPQCSINNHPREYVEPTEFHQCPHCPYKSAKEWSFRIHLRNNHVKPEKCNHCDRLFKNKFRLDNHMRENHGSTEYHCPDCDFVSCIQSKLDKHVKNNHTRPEKCTQCDKSFGTPKVLKEHFRIAHSDNSHIYKCNLCLHSYSRKEHLRGHLKTVHESSLSKPFECATCHRTFRSKEKLEHHVARIHELRNCEPCPHCKKLYSRISVHLIRCLKNPDRKLERLKCPGCDKTYFHSKNLNIHLKKNICDGRRAHGRLRSKNARFS